MAFSAEDFQRWIIRETNHWLAINKPAGLIVEKSPFEAPTIEDLALAYLNHQHRNPFLGIVHRLDRVTTGVLLLAKKRSALRNFNEQFRLGKVQKVYWAMVTNAPPKRKGTLSHWLTKDQKNKKAIIKDGQTKESSQVVLDYQVIKETEEGIWLEIKPRTGKFHQIRAQLSFMGCPIVGDYKYQSNSPTEHVNKIALHAKQLLFYDPFKESPEIIYAPNPNWKNALK